MKVKRILSIFCILACLAVGFCGCQTDGEKQIEKPTVEPYPRDFLCGYMLTFSDSNDENYIPPTSDDFLNDNAVTRYVGLKYFENSNIGFLFIDGGLFVNNSHNKISIKNDPLTTNKSGSISMNEELFYTHELKDKQAKLHYIYYNAEERKLYSNDYSSVTDLTGADGLIMSDEMQARIFNADEELDTITYRFDLSIEFREIDTLEDVTITKYDDNDNPINSISKSSRDLKDLNNYQYEYEAADCQYVIISKQYKNSDGENYTERTLYNKDKLAQSEIIYVPYGNGLTMPMEIQLRFAD